MAKKKSVPKHPGRHPRLTVAHSAPPLDSGHISGSDNNRSDGSPDEFGALVNVLRSAERFEPSPILTGEATSEPGSDWTRCDESEGSSDDFVALVNILRSVERSESFPDRTREEELVELRLPEDVSILESAGLREVARSLAAAESCVTVVPEPTAPPVRDVITAKMFRAAAILELLRFLKGDYGPVRTVASIRAVIQRVVQSADSERRIRGVTLSTTSTLNDLWIAGDEVLLSQVLLSLLLTTFALLKNVENPRVALGIEDSGGGSCALSIVQVQAPAPPAWTAHSKGETGPNDADDVFRMVALSACHRLAQTCGGRFIAVSGKGSTKLSIDLPIIKAAGVN